MASREEIAAIIRERAMANGVDPDVLLRMAHIESGLNPNAQSNTSSAGGLFQFLDKTWGQFGKGDKFDPVASSDAGARYLLDNAKALGTTDPGALYLGHFAGAGGAKALREADPATPAVSILGDKVIAANPFLRGMTAADVQNWASNKMGIAGGAINSVAAVPSAKMPAVTAASPSPSASPFSLAGTNASPATPDITDGLGTLAVLKSLAGQNEDRFASAQPQQTINYPTPAGLARARAIAKVMHSRRLA